jgi:hypothetical protein
VLHQPQVIMGIWYRMGKEKARERLSDFRPRPFVGWAAMG